ncbi:hypothetical protein C6P42_003284 [Pichia californica]|nr:hypothetical protein C6P42_003284 [[Candida] californica]
MTIPPSLDNGNDLLTDINLIHQDIYKMNPNIDSKKMEKLNLKLKKTLDTYLINNSCLRYYLNDYIQFNNIEPNQMEIHSNEGFMIAINIEFINEESINSKVQKINLSLIDKNINILRRINNINQRNLKLLINYPLTEKNEEYFNDQYFDMCFENVKYDKSWTSKQIEVDSNIEINFGIEEISNKYHQSTLLIYDAQNELMKIDKELEIIIDQLLNNLKTSEPELRNKNEDTLDKFMKLFIFTFVIFLIVNFFQGFWLIKYLKKHGLF